MHITTTEFPFVWLRYTGSTHTDPARLIAELDTLLARRERFVLLTDDAPSGDDRGADDHELRKQLAKWSKANRAQSREWIPAMIAIEPDASRRVALNAFSGAFEKVWGYPLNAAATRDDALALAQRLLDEPVRDAVAANG
ncbi:ATP--cob(I)alamin adenosyltransferase [Burkholderia lata]|uniref:ATP--cob(I)alamin adenosyltransferase n=1 Tax=Burkholderia lata (strain ATCC 17760 / DSM 23089 / LMG 22485 / NCIMB 9086 / R18194 / 383) TaxID=482957 RepID=UPI0014543D59|nr:ATP--cob(I)alamin adenosyltransferase [Burkholderia lata]VWB70730.1 ATP--cob(I)alamin adenosyltransferase [Burkholderia lata]VWC56402.1 ATP--cob(I)alamin adenosyltransferase [Burkholderia lata]